jgi:hypothetical protein
MPPVIRCAARRANVFGVMMSLNMLLTIGDGFGDVEILPLTGLTSAGIAHK